MKGCGAYRLAWANVEPLLPGVETSLWRPEAAAHDRVDGLPTIEGRGFG